MRFTMQLAAAAVVATMLVAGCGGSDEAQTVNGCVIEPDTSCPAADLSGADLSNADLSRARLGGVNLEGADLGGANLTDADLSGSQIVDADLSDADLTRANLTGATITGTELAGATLCGTRRTDGTVDDTSCPATTETTESAAELTSFEVGDLSCGAATTAPVMVTWETSDATAVDIGVDAVSPAGFGPLGSTNVVVPCDGASHTITLTPRNDAGAGEAESKEVSPS